jgi:hypothetical protein
VLHRDVTGLLTRMEKLQVVRELFYGQSLCVCERESVRVRARARVCYMCACVCVCARATCVCVLALRFYDRNLE